MSASGALLPRGQAEHSPIFQQSRASPAVRRPGFTDLEGGCGSIFDGYERVSIEPSLLVFLAGAQVPARAEHRDIGHAFQFEPQHLVDMPGYNELHAVLAGQLVEREIRVAQGYRNHP